MDTTSFRRRRYPHLALWAAALVCLNGVACFRSLDLSKVKCNSIKSSCPPPYSCAMDQGTYGHCVLGAVSLDGGNADQYVSPASDGEAGSDGIRPSGGTGGSPRDGALSSGGAGGGGPTGGSASGGAASGGISGGSGGNLGGSGGISSPDAPGATGGTTAAPDGPVLSDGPDAPTSLPNGSICTAAGQCSSNSCVDGHCCDSKCDGNCETCATGTCSFTSTPRKACSGSGKCAGTCDKSDTKACTYPDSSTVCAAQSCAAGQRTNKSLCDGQGNCPIQTPTACDSNQCLADNSDCSGTCTVASCGAGKYCTGSTCAPLKNQGDTCSADGECSTTHCVDGYCCESACTGACTSCSVTHGKCTNTTSARSGKACGGTAPCNASCTGSSPDCVPASSTTSCGITSCLSSTQLQLAGTCTSQGTCSQSTQTCTACVANACADCTPGVDRKCSSAGAPQKCDATGHWANDTACGTGQVCSGAGSCGCQTNWTSCGRTGNTCYDSSNDSHNCGSASSCVDCTTTGRTCSGGSCVCSNTSNPNFCNNACTNFSTDNSNCGGCGTKCTSPNTCGGNGTPNACGCTPNCGTRVCGAVPNGCGTSCGTCQAPNQCNSSGQCTCTPNPNACSGRQCGSVSDGCTTIPCGTCTSPKTCNGSGSCVCSVGYATCNTCLAWDFESGSIANWSVSTNDSYGNVQLAVAAGRGNYSLAITNVQLYDNPSDITVLVSLCNGAAVSYPASGFTFSAEVRFQSPTGLGFGDDGTGSGSPGIILAGDAPGSLISAPGVPFTSGVWYPISRTFTGDSLTTMGLRFRPMVGWTGTIYLDNISLQ